MKLSIIVAVHNSADYLPRMIDSVLEQSLEDLEVVCIDTGSDDLSCSIIEEYVASEDRVKLIKLDRSSLSNDPLLDRTSAFNKGIEAAEGEYIIFLEPTDEVMPYSLEVICKKADLHELDCLRYAAIMLNPETDETMKLTDFTLEDMKPAFFLRILGFDASSPRYDRIPDHRVCLYKRSFLLKNEIRFSEKADYGSRIFLYKVILKAKRMTCCRDRVLFDRIREDISFTNGLDGLKNMLGLQDMIGDLLARENASKDVRDRIMLNEFSGICDYFGRAVFSVEDRSPYIEMMQDYIETKGDRLETAYKKCFKETLAILAGHSAPVPVKAVKTFFDPVSNPRVSVVVPVYNQQEYLNHALDSLRKQTLKQIEFILVNDGSTDASMAIMREYATFDKRFRILDGSNGGYGKAMNRGMEAAKGEYIGILEPDDFVPTNMYEDLYLAAKGYNVQIVRADFRWFTENEDGTYNRRYRKLSLDDSDYNRVINPKHEPRVMGFIMNTWTGIYETEFIRKNKLKHNETPGASYQDNGFYFTTMAKCDRVVFINRPYYMYRKDNPNASVQDNTDKKLYCITNEFRYIRDWMEKNPDTRCFEAEYEKLRYNNFVLSYRRATDKARPEYLRHMRDEFKDVLKKGVLTEENLGHGKYKTLAEIVDIGEGYFDKIRYTACLPFKNDSARIEDFIRVTIGRNEGKMEFACVDCGSTDGTADIVAEMAKDDERIRLIKGEEEETASILNKVIDEAEGEYLLFLSMEYRYDADYLRQVAYTADDKEADIVICNSKGIEGNDRFPSEGAAYAKNKDILPASVVFSFEDIIEDNLRSTGTEIFDKCFSMEFIRKNGLRFNKDALYYSQDFTVRALRKADRITVRNMKLVRFEVDDESIYDPVRFLDEMYEAYDVLNADRQLKRAFTNYALYRISRGLLLTREDFDEVYDQLQTDRISAYGIEDIPDEDVTDPMLVRIARRLRTLNSHEFMDNIRHDLFQASEEIEVGEVRELNAATSDRRQKERLSEARKAQKRDLDVIHKLEVKHYEDKHKVRTTIRKIRNKLK